MFQRGLKGVSREFQGSFKDVLRECRNWLVCFKGDFSGFQGYLKSLQKEFQGRFQSISRVFQGSFKSVPRKFLDA